jgi:DNA-binding response OmpR family regulator
MSSVNANFKILIVDDSKMMQTNISEFLKADGFDDIDCADDGEMGLKFYERAYLRGEPYDLIILDVEMPTMTGVQMLKLIRKQDKDTKVMMLTTHNDRPTIQKAILIGANGYLLKPFDHDELMTRVYKHISTKELF